MTSLPQAPPKENEIIKAINKDVLAKEIRKTIKDLNYLLKQAHEHNLKVKATGIKRRNDTLEKVTIQNIYEEITKEY